MNSWLALISATPSVKQGTFRGAITMKVISKSQRKFGLVQGEFAPRYMGLTVCSTSLRVRSSYPKHLPAA